VSSGAPAPPGARNGQGLPAGNGPGTGAGLRGVGDARHQPAQLDRGRELAVLLVDGTDRGGLSLGDNEHAGRMGARIEGGKLCPPALRLLLKEPGRISCSRRASTGLLRSAPEACSLSTVAQPAARIGRPRLTLAMDVDSRMVAGFLISLDPPCN
jgi:hypothetical protein